MASRLSTLILLALLLIFQGQLWIGRGSVPHVWELEKKLVANEAKNAALKTANAQLLSDVKDLREGQELIEDRARSELGMIKSNEIFVQYAK